jgi:hypothetical protein
MICRRHLSALFAASVWTATALRADEPIIFTKPADLPTEKANSFMEQMPHKLADVHSAPSSVFGQGEVDFDRLPGAQFQPQLTPQQLQKLQKQMDEKKNWALGTPEEILGVPTVEKIMGLPEHGTEDQLSMEERYLHRQERQRNETATNSLSVLTGLDENPFGLSERKRKQDGQNLLQEKDGRANYLNRELAASRLQPRENAARNGNGFWKSAFDPQPQVVSQAGFDQQAALDRYRATMEMSAMEKPTAVSEISHPAMPMRDPNLQPLPDYNPAGSTVRPLQDTIGRPTGIMPLPTVTGTRPTQSLPEKRKPLVNQPPWLQDGSSPPTTPPMRKF